MRAVHPQEFTRVELRGEIGQRLPDQMSLAYHVNLDVVSRRRNALDVCHIEEEGALARAHQDLLGRRWSARYPSQQAAHSLFEVAAIRFGQRRTDACHTL